MTPSKKPERDCDSMEVTLFNRGWNAAIDATTPPAAQPAAPEGWKLVPVEPTHGMVKAFQDAMSLEFGMRTTAGYHARVYSAMLTAAPEKGQP